MQPYSNNTLVLRRRGRCPSCDYVQIYFQPELDNNYYQSQVMLTRYTCPGRFDIYHFDYTPSPSSGFSSKIRFSSEGTSLPEAMRLLAKDLNRPQVVRLLLEACEGRRFLTRTLCECLLRSIAPKSKAYKALCKLNDQQQARRDAELAEKYKNDPSRKQKDSPRPRRRHKSTNATG